MPCDAGRLAATLKFCLFNHDDSDFQEKQNELEAGLLEGNSVKVLDAIFRITKDHDDGAYHACLECEQQTPGIVVAAGRLIAKGQQWP
jgi:hypothetical protein